jgi:rubrerythrin
MTEHSDLRKMIEVLSISIVREETEEYFYRRSAARSTSQVVKDLFLEIAGEVAKHRQNLELRRKRLLDTLEDLKKAEENLGSEVIKRKR